MIARILRRIGPTTNHPGWTLALVCLTLLLVGAIERPQP